MRLTRIILAATLSAALTGCASLRQIGPDEEAALRETAVSLAADAPDLQPMERSILQDGAYSFFIAMARRDPDFARNALTGLRAAEDFQYYALRRFGMTSIELGIDASMTWDAETAFDYGNPKKTMDTLRTEHFTLMYYPGTRAAADLDRISFLAERTLEELLNLMAPSEDARERFGSNLQRVNDGSISLILPPSSRYWKSFNATAQMTFGIRANADGEVSFDMTIGVPYFNALSCATLTHEITHMVDLLCKLSPQDLVLPADVTSKNAESLLGTRFKEIMQRIFPHDTPLGEGVAMYTAKNMDLFHRFFLMSATDNLKASAARRPVRTDILLKSPVALDRRTRILQYEELHSLVDYLVARDGWERFREFYLSPPLTEERFTEFYGMGYADIEREWRAAEGL